LRVSRWALRAWRGLRRGMLGTSRAGGGGLGMAGCVALGEAAKLAGNLGFLDVELLRVAVVRHVALDP